MLLGEVMVDTGWTVGATILCSALGGLVALFFKHLTEYRKASDAGQLALVQAEQASVKLQLESIRQRADAAEEKAKTAIDHARQCDEMHRQADLDRAEMRGLLKASQEERANLGRQLLQLSQENAELRGQVNILKVQVARDTSDTLQLAEKHSKTEARVAKLENGGPAHRPPHQDG